MMSFRVGQRVIVTGWTLNAGDPANGMNGYYGHVVALHRPTAAAGRWVIGVALSGRVDYPARQRDLDAPQSFYVSELQAAD